MNSRPRCGCDVVVGPERKYIRLLCVEAYTKIFVTSSRTNLTQTFERSPTSLEELRYVFPLYEGVSVVSFTAYIGSKTIHGVVKEKSKASQVYAEAKDEGKVAGLLVQSSSAGDVFIAKVGNVPASEIITIEIEYLADLEHDLETNAIRFTIPTSIAPRYGPSELLETSATVASASEKGFSVTIDAEMPDGSAIKSIQSPSHPIAVHIGKTSRAPSENDLSLSKASATLSLGAAELADDFVVQIDATKLGEPSAMLETHPDMHNQRALMTTLVPKFNIPAEKPELVFVCDRSGSMDLAKISKLQSALNVFLKSIPLGTKFNLVSFGSRHEFLWDRSQTYSQDTLDKAIDYVDAFTSNFGGTEMYQPVADTFERRYKDMNLEVFLLTDGQIMDQDQLFKLINSRVTESKGAIRVFTIGIGRAASHALIQGAARAGNGVSQSVGDNEQATTKFIRMLKASLTPHITDYSLELKYRNVSKEAEDDGFELVEKIDSGLEIDTLGQKAEQTQRTISLFDHSAADRESDPTCGSNVAQEVDDKYDHLPNVVTPRYIQSPHVIPPMFPFHRTTVYVLLAGTDQNLLPTSLLLKGSSTHGPLELEVPITILPDKGTTIHQLAARNTIRELEEGRGWIFQASHPDSGKLLQNEFEGRFSDMVEREAVKLGVQHQITGKWTSFVAVADGEDGLLAEIGVDTHHQAYSPLGRLSTVRCRKRREKAVTTNGMRGGGSQPRFARSFDTCAAGPEEDADSSDENQGFALFDDEAPAPKPVPKPMSPLQHLISMQRFDGSWAWTEDLEDILGIGESQVLGIATGKDTDSLATVTVILYLENKLPGDKDTWDMIIRKAESWVKDREGEAIYENLREAIKSLF